MVASLRQRGTIEGSSLIAISARGGEGLVHATQDTAAQVDDTVTAPRSSAADAIPEPDLRAPDFYTNRELSWLEFNERVLAEAFDDRNPLLERAKFLAIAANNLDEFFMVRVSALKKLVAAGFKGTTPDGRTAKEQLAAIDKHTRQMLDDMGHCFTQVLVPMLETKGLAVREWDDLANVTRAQLSEYFREQIFPVLTPLAVDPAHPFPYISNLSLNLAVMLRDPLDGRELFARVKVPQNLLHRFIRLPGSDETILLEQLVAAHLGMLFPGMEILQCHSFRVTRDADIEFEEDQAEDLMDEIEAGLRTRRFRDVILLTVPPAMPQQMRDLLVRELEVSDDDLCCVPGPHGLADLFDLAQIENQPDLFFDPWKPQTPPGFRDCEGEPADLFEKIRQGDILVHHPYESFDTSVDELIRQAVSDPDVLAVKQTLYRTTENSDIMRALVQAAEAGKQVVVVVEIKARFDEERNILWARRLEAAGAHVGYGLVGLKTHAKAVLVVRQEDGRIRRYMHLGTGNYNAKTAGLYEDFGLFTCRNELGADLSDLFNFLTGYSRQREFRSLFTAPYGLREHITERIQREIDLARAGRPARMVLKVNGLVDAKMIRHLYEASQAGVEIDLIVRGICCLRPGIPGVSENIRVRSIIGRFLEHSRIYHFHNDGDDEYLIGSADLMPRNLDRRVEQLVPVQDRKLQEVLHQILDVELTDNRQAWLLQPDDSWLRVTPKPGESPRGTHDVLMQRALDRSVGQGS